MVRAAKAPHASALTPSEDWSTAWIDLADAALRRLAVLHRVGRGQPPDDLAGLRVDDEEIDHLLVELTDGDAAGAVERARRSLDPVVANRREQFAASLCIPSPFAALVANAGIDPVEAELLAICVALEMDSRRQRLLAYAQDDVTRTRLTLQTVLRLFGVDQRAVAAVGPDSALRRSALVRVEEDGPWATHTVVVRPSVVWALMGDWSLDPGLPSGAFLVLGDDAGGDGGDGDALVVVTGPDRLRRRAEAVLRAAGDRFLVVAQPADEAEWSAVVAEATIGGLGVVVELDGDLSPLGRRCVERAVHLSWALSTKFELPLTQLPDRPWLEFVAPDDEPTDAEWEAAFGPGVPREHRLSREQVDLVGKAFVAQRGDFDAAVRRLVSGRLERLARRIRPTRTWDDIVLQPEPMEQLRDLVARYRHADQVYDEWGFSALPSRGLVALFSGPSGTGKTMATEIIAGDLGLDVFKLDLSSVVSKYIGETEKNLEEVFDAARAGNLVLFFDEADALFGKRSEVKDARDRYANIEVSYLLQRLESYDGVVVLATNFEKNVDDAFLRRIHSRVEFALPKAPERRAIWQRNLPASAPVEGVDLDELAERFEMSGGSIRNAAVHSAFLAAAAGSAISMEFAIRGVGREYRKLGKLIRAEDFGERYSLVAPLKSPPGPSSRARPRSK